MDSFSSENRVGVFPVGNADSKAMLGSVREMTVFLPGSTTKLYMMPYKRVRRERMLGGEGVGWRCGGDLVRRPM